MIAHPCKLISFDHTLSCVVNIISCVGCTKEIRALLLKRSFGINSQVLYHVSVWSDSGTGYSVLCSCKQ